MKKRTMKIEKKKWIKAQDGSLHSLEDARSVVKNEGEGVLEIVYPGGEVYQLLDNLEYANTILGEITDMIEDKNIVECE